MSSDRFDHPYNKFQQDGALMRRHVQKGMNEFRLAKRCAYRMAMSYLEMHKRFTNDLIDHVHSAGFTGDNAIDQWLDQWFVPMESMGDDYRDLIKAVQDGMTEKGYMAKTAGIFLAEKRRQCERREVAEAPLPEAPKEDLSDIDWRQQMISRDKVLEVENRELKRKVRDLTTRNAKLERAMNRMQRQFANLKIA